MSLILVVVVLWAGGVTLAWPAWIMALCLDVLVLWVSRWVQNKNMKAFEDSIGTLTKVFDQERNVKYEFVVHTSECVDGDPDRMAADLIKKTEMPS